MKTKLTSPTPNFSNIFLNILNRGLFLAGKKGHFSHKKLLLRWKKKEHFSPAASVKSRQARQVSPTPVAGCSYRRSTFCLRPRLCGNKVLVGTAAGVRDFHRCGIIPRLALANRSVPMKWRAPSPLNPRRSILRDASA